MFLICFRVFHHDSIRRLVNCLGFGFEPGSDSTLTPVNCWEIQKWGESVELGSGFVVIGIAARTFLVRYVSDVWRCEDKERLILAFNENLWRQGRNFRLRHTTCLITPSVQILYNIGKHCLHVCLITTGESETIQGCIQVYLVLILFVLQNLNVCTPFYIVPQIRTTAKQLWNNKKLNKNVGTELICWILPSSGASVRSWSMNCPICMRRWLVVVDIRPSGGGSLSSCSCLLSLRALGSRTASNPLLNLYLIVSYIQTCR